MSKDLRCMVWVENPMTTQTLCMIGTELIPATRHIFSCVPEARAYVETLPRDVEAHIVPLALHRSICEYDRQGTQHTIDESLPQVHRSSS